MRTVRHKGAVWQVLSEVPTEQNGLVYNLYRRDQAGTAHWTFAKAVECVEVRDVPQESLSNE
jgi:hypothetical protein